ncbi:MAG: sugar ABC transporter permease [Spirochaetales bacterium]|nr:sugar ABC transporter permease [Spirochaetales bacterium]
MKLSGRKINQQIVAPYVFLGPYFILYAIFGVFPVFFALFLGFQKWSGMGINTMQFVGLKNFIFLLTEDIYFWKTLGNTGWLLIFGSLAQHIFAIPLASLLNNKLIRGRELYKTAYFLPFITSAVSIAIIYSYVFNTNYGFLNQMLKFLGVYKLFGIEKIMWLDDKALIKPVIAVVLNWRYIGWNTVIYLAGLQAIPDDYYEAAKIDGANSIQMLLRITIPLLLPIIFLAVTMSVIGGWQLFDEPYNLTGGYQLMGRADNAGFTSAFYIMWLLQRAGRLGKGSAITWYLFFIIIAMTAINRLIVNRFQGEDESSKLK